MVKVSVIIPVYNVEDYLGECLDSVLNQTLQDIEVVCVNDGSTDKSLQVLQTYAEKDNRIKIITQPNQGLSVTRNTGLENASGKYVYFVDSDDLIPSDALEKLYGVCEDKNLDLVYFSADVFYEDSDCEAGLQFQGQYIRKGEYKEVKSGKDLMVELYNNKDYMMSACMVFLRREFLLSENISFYNSILHEDNLYTFTCLMKAKRAFCINDICFHRRVRSNSIMTVKETYKNLLGYYKCLLEQYKIAFSTQLSEEQNEIVCTILINLLRHVHRIFSLLDDENRELVKQNLNHKERFFFEGLIIVHLHNTYGRYVETIHENDRLQGVLSGMCNSYTYRISRKLSKIFNKFFKNMEVK